MTLADWRANVSSHLQFIEAGAEMVARHTRSLPCRPAFQSKAQDELTATRKVLETALAKIIAAEIAYDMKPLETEHAA